LAEYFILHADLAEDLHGPLVEADGFGVDGGAGLALEEHVLDAVEREQDGRDEAYRTAANNGDSHVLRYHALIGFD